MLIRCYWLWYTIVYLFYLSYFQCPKVWKIQQSQLVWIRPSFAIVLFTHHSRKIRLLLVHFPIVHPPNRGIIFGWLWHVMMRQEAKIGNMWPLDPPHIILTSLCTYIANPPLIFRLSSPPHKHFDCCIFLCVFWEYCCVGVCFCGTSKVNNVQRWLPPPNWTWWWQFWR